MYGLFQRAISRLQLFPSDLPFLQYTHHPNCSSVSDDQLANTVHGVWPNSNGKASINYIFSLPAYWWMYANPLDYHLRNLDKTTVDIFQETVRVVVSKLQKANNGILNFREIARSFKTDYSPFFRGIYYAQTASEQQFTQDNSGAFTYIQYDNNRDIKRAIVHLPTDLSIYNDSSNEYPPFWSDYAISHESYHALGQEHLQDFPNILSELLDTPDGVFCSVMDYPNLVGSNISSCMTNCTPQYAALPGPLDIRSMQLAYLQGNYDRGYNKFSDYFYNGAELGLFFAFTMLAYSILYALLKKLFLRDNNYLSNRSQKNIIETLLNIAVLTILIEMETPVYLTVLFGLTTGLKLLSPACLKRMSYQPDGCFDYMTRMKYPFVVLGLAASFSEGKVFFGFLFELWLGMTGLLLGNFGGKALGWLFLKIIIKTIDAVSTRLFPGNSDQPTTTSNDIELVDYVINFAAHTQAPALLREASAPLLESRSVYTEEYFRASAAARQLDITQFVSKPRARKRLKAKLEVIVENEAKQAVQASPRSQSDQKTLTSPTANSASPRQLTLFRPAVVVSEDMGDPLMNLKSPVVLRRASTRS